MDLLFARLAFREGVRPGSSVGVRDSGLTRPSAYVDAKMRVNIC
jgi:hypothetical protein